MATLPEIYAALRDQIDDALSEADDVTVHVESMPWRAAELPAVDMFPISAQALGEGLTAFGDTYGGIPIAVRVRVSPADVEAGFSILLALIDDQGPLSVVNALDDDHSLGGLLSDLAYEDGWPWTGLQDFSAEGDGSIIGSTLPIIVIKAPS